MNLLILDVDGVVRKPIKGQFIDSPSNQKLIPETHVILTKNYTSDRWIVLGVSNQGGVEKNHKSLEDCIQEQETTLNLCSPLKGILFCPDYLGESCYLVTIGGAVEIKQENNTGLESFRMPGIGMLNAAIVYWDTVNIKPTHPLEGETIWMIGAYQEGLEAAKKKNIPFFWVDHWIRESL